MFHYKIGVDTFIWSENFSENDLWIISKAKELGFEALDIAIAHPEAFPTQKVKQKLDEVGIEVVTSLTLNNNTNPISPDPQIRKNALADMKLTIDINREIGSKILGGVNYASWGYLTKRPRTEQEWEWAVTNMRQAAEYAKATSDVKICVEPVNRFETHFLNIAEDAIRFCDDVGTGNVKVHLDTFHMIREEESYSKAVELCGKKYLGYVHVCESNRGIPGTGLVPWQEFFTAIQKVGYDGPMVIESFDPSFEELSGNCAIWRKFAESGEELAVKGLANLRRIISEL
jgi:D-psicose/D-tagatose/L-ribulose 3-epimerase